MGYMVLMALALTVHVNGAAAQTDPSSQCKQDALASYNFFRAIHQAPALVWNETLASEAQDQANSLISSDGCALPTDANDRNIARVNADYSWTSPCSFSTLILYAYGLNWTFSGSKKPIADNTALLQDPAYMYLVLVLGMSLLQVMSFLRIIWAGHTDLGCGTAQATTGCWSVVCRFYPEDPFVGSIPDTSEVTENAYAKNIRAPIALGNLTANGSCNSAILSNHNKHRAEYQSPPMTWDTMLAAGAQAYATEVAKHGCPFKTSAIRVRETFESWTDGADSTICAHFAANVYRWACAYKFTNTPWTDNDKAMGFADMVARHMTKIGCGLATGPDGCASTVCWYGPVLYWTDQSLFQDVRLPVATPAVSNGPCQQAALARLNQFRADHSASSLSLNSSLVAVAQGLADSAASGGCDISSLVNDNGVDGFTVNASSNPAVCGQAVDLFYGTGNTTFSFTATPWTDNSGTYAQWHTFTQVIWKNTTQVGCGSAQGPDGCWVVICKYEPPGNMQTDTAFIQNVSPSEALVAPPPPRASSSGSSDSSSNSSKGNDSGSGHSSSTIAIVIGVCVGGGVLVALGAGFLIWHRRRKRNQSTANHDAWSKASKAPLASSDNNTATGLTGSSGPLDTTNMQQHASYTPSPASHANPIMAIPGLMTGEPFTRGTAFEYSWNSMYSFKPGVTQAVESGVNDLHLDMLVQGSRGQVQECPVVCLSKEEVKQQLQLLTNGLRGRGGAALVFKALWPSRFGPDALLAVKVMKDGYDANPYIMQSFAHEASVLASVCHPNVVKLYGYCLDPPNVCLIMELLPCSLKEVLYGTHDTAADTSELGVTSILSDNSSHGTPKSELLKQISAKEGVPLTMSQVLQVSTEIAAGLAYLHDQPQQMLKDTEGTTMPVLAEEVEAATDEHGSALQKIVHRDLKPANILINSLGQVKISDFGLARCHDSTTIETKNMGAGTVPYQAPEILTLSRTGALGMKATNRCDIYSMAMIFWELLAKQPPWKDMNEVNIIVQVINSKRPELPPPDRAHSIDDTSLDLRQLPASLTALPAYNDIIRQCWAQRDWRRPTAADAHRLLMELQRKYQAAGAATVQVTIAESAVK